MATITQHFLVHGRVQGVGFRDWTERAAKAHGVEGWCRNRSDGTVEIAARGSRDVLDLFRTDLEQGPPAAEVDHIETVDDAPLIDADKGFEIRSTSC